MSRRKRAFDITDIHGYAGPMDAVPPVAHDTSARTPMRNPNDAQFHQPLHSQRARMEPKLIPTSNNRNQIFHKNKSCKDSKNKASGGPMSRRMCKSLFPSCAKLSNQHPGNATHSRLPTTLCQTRRSDSSPRVPPDEPSPNSHSKGSCYRTNSPGCPEPKAVYGPPFNRTPKPKAETQPPLVRARRNGSSPHASRNTVSSATLSGNVRNSRMTVAQRIKQINDGFEQSLKCSSSRKTSEAKKLLTACHGHEKRTVSEVIDLDSEPQAQRPVEAADGELVSDSDDESLHFSDGSDGSILANLKKPPRFSSVPDGKENRPDVIDLSRDEPPARSRLKKANSSLPSSTWKPAETKSADPKIGERPKDPNEWKKVSEPLKSFDGLGAVHGEEAGEETIKAAKVDDLDFAKVAIDAAISESPHMKDLERGGSERDNRPPSKTSHRCPDVAEKEKRPSQISAYCKEKKQQSGSAKRRCIQNIVPPPTKQVHLPFGNTGKNPTERVERNDITMKIRPQGSTDRSFPVQKEVCVAPPKSNSDVQRVSRNIRLTPLTKGELLEVKSVTQGVRKQEPLAFVKEANIMLKGEDFSRLRGCRWLNDEVMNSFVALINARNDKYHKGDGDVVMTDVDIAKKGRFGSVKEGDGCSYLEFFKKPRPRTHAFNTFFFARLTQGDGYDYSGVRRWLRRAGKDIRTLDLILVPINLSQFHWVLAAIDIRHRQFLYFDSMFGHDTVDALEILRMWLIDEVNDKGCGDFLNEGEISKWRAIANPTYMPSQNDSGSCGVFTLYLAEYLERGAVPDFKQQNIQTLRQRIVLFLKHGVLPD